MKKSTIYFIAGVFLFSIVAFTMHRAPTNPEDDFSNTFSKVLVSAKEYTLEMAEAMPEEHYTFRPTDSVRSFGEQLAHIGLSTKFLLAVFVKGEQLEFDPVEGQKKEAEIGASKEQAIAVVIDAFDDAINTLKAMDSQQLNEKFIVVFDPAKPELTKKEAFLLLRDHITHHRGQAITSLRMKEKKAPQYRAY